MLVFVDASYRWKATEVVLDDLTEALKDLEVDGSGFTSARRRSGPCSELPERGLPHDGPAQGSVSGATRAGSLPSC